jgi:hypothetical protein
VPEEVGGVEPATVGEYVCVLPVALSDVSPVVLELVDAVPGDAVAAVLVAVAGVLVAAAEVVTSTGVWVPVLVRAGTVA